LCRLANFTVDIGDWGLVSQRGLGEAVRWGDTALGGFADL